jgi:hypothetical protein
MRQLTKSRQNRRLFAPLPLFSPIQLSFNPPHTTHEVSAVAVCPADAQTAKKETGP